MQQLFIQASSTNALICSSVIIIFLCISVTSIQAQLPPPPEHGFQPAGSFALSNIESINVANGNMMLRVPLASLPPGRGNSPGFELSLNYNSKLYDTHIEEIPDEGTGQIVQQIHLNPSEQGGWHYNVSPYTLQLISRLDLEGWTDCNPLNCSSWLRNAYIYKLKVIFPDSGEHEFRPLGYTDYLMDGYYDIDPNGLQWGTTCNPQGGCNIGSNQATTAGMTYYSTDGSFLRLDVPYSATGNWMANWTLSFPDGRRVITTGGVQRIHDRNDNYVEIQSITYNGHPARKVLDQLGRFIIIEFDGAAARDYIYAAGTNGETLTWTIKWKTIYAYKAYRATTSGTQHGNVYPQTGSNTPVVVDQIILPAQAGSLAYTFAYNAPDTDPYPDYSTGWGEISSITLPSGAQAAYGWTFDGSTAPGPLVTFVLQAAVTHKDLIYLAEYDGSSTPVTDTWTYSAPMNYGSSMTITAPDGGITRNYSSNTGPFARQAYKTENPDGSMIERVWQQNIPYQNPAMNSGVNPYIKTEFTSIKDAVGSFVLTAIKDYNYDKNGNLTQVKEYDWVSYTSAHPGGGGPVIPAGLQPKRVALNTFFNPSPDASDTSYNANVYNQPTAAQSRNVSTSSEVRDDAQPVSRTEFFYDNASTTANLTQVKSWDSTKANYSNPLTAGNSISTSTQYNIYGGPILNTDARGFQAQLTYDAIGGFTDLYPTKIKTAYGTSVQRSETREYDFSTGLVTRVTDVDNNVSSATTYDIFGRPTLVKAAVDKPEETRTSTSYSDVNRRVIVKSDLVTVGDEKLVTIQHYDQLGRVRLTRQLEDATTQSATDETTGIKVQTRYQYSGNFSYVLSSNPYRASTSAAAGSEATMGWSRSKSDNGGRLIEVQTFAGATVAAPWGTNTSGTGTVAMAYDANFTTVTDQAGKVRRSMTDGLGRLSRVDEPDASGNLGSTISPVQPTSYSYNALANLIIVNQGSQTRTFVYSSLGRLISATNPESGTISYEYDNNGNLTKKTDALSIDITYTYDALNRNTAVDYSDTTIGNPNVPDITRFYDSATNGKGRIWYSYKAGNFTVGDNVEHTAIDSYDALGRPLVQRQLSKLNGTWGPTYQTSRSYNRANNVTSQTYPSGHTVSYTYDGAGRTSGFTGNIGDGVSRTYASTFVYNAQNQITQELFGTQTELYHKLQYNPRGQLWDVRVSTGADINGSWNRGCLQFFYDVSYGYGTTGPDNNGNVLKTKHYVPMDEQSNAWAIHDQSYTYDSVNRISSVAEYFTTNTQPLTQQSLQSYSYDRYGNRTIDAAQTWGVGINNKQFAVDASTNRLGVPGQQSGVMTYDDAGNLITDTYTGAGAREYDAENRMTRAWGGNNQWQE